MNGYESSLPQESPSSADRSPHAPRLQVGDELHRGFFLQQKLGVGTLGDTWLANDTIDERQVVLKIVPLDIQQNPQSDKVFRDSYKQVENLRHPSLRGLHPLTEDVIHGFFVVADYLEAMTLDKYYHTYTAATGGQFPLSTMVRVFWPIARALDFAHNHRMYHHRLTSNNILVGRDCGVQLTDLHYPDVAQRLVDSWIKEEPEFPDKEDQKDFANLIHRTLFAENFFDVDKRKPNHTADTTETDLIPTAEKDRTVENCAAPILRAIRRATSARPAERFGSCQDFLRAAVGAPLTDEPDSDSEEDWDILSVAATKPSKHGLLVAENLMSLDDAAFAQSDPYLWDSMWESSDGGNIAVETEDVSPSPIEDSEANHPVVAEPKQTQIGDTSHSTGPSKSKSKSKSTSTSTSKTVVRGTTDRLPVSWSQLKRHFFGVGGGLVAAVLVLAGMSAMMDFFGEEPPKDSEPPVSTGGLNNRSEEPLNPALTLGAKIEPPAEIPPLVEEPPPVASSLSPTVEEPPNPALTLGAKIEPPADPPPTVEEPPPIVEEPPVDHSSSNDLSGDFAALHPPLFEPPPLVEEPLNPALTLGAKIEPPVEEPSIVEELPLMVRAELGDIESQRTLGEHYLLGTGGYTKDAVQAVSWLRAAAMQRDVAATYSLGKCYEAGFGVSKNDEMAFRLYETAAKSGDVRAELRVGWCYGQGVGTEKNPQTAAKWYRTAAEQGEPQAQVRIGACYEAGVGVEKDLTQAKLWYEKAAEQGNQDAADGLQRIQLAE